MIRHSFHTGRVEMPANLVNLDALIRREDFAVAGETMEKPAVEGSDKLKIFELEKDSLMFKWLRKPDFQRTTAHWPPLKVAGFINSFLAGDLIPALIFWQSSDSGNIFVIDGAHRLSALIAWVHDDYGDRQISVPFFENNIPPEQKKAADETRKIVNQQVGSYTELKHGENLTPERKRFAAFIAADGITLQWVRGDATRAERSFHTINTEQTPIGELEVRMIRDRRCPNAIAARALVRAGTGQTWKTTFLEDNKTQIKAIAKQIYDDLFVPPLETPIRTLELPVAGRSYSSESIRTILDLVEFVNGDAIAPPVKKKRGEKRDILAPTMAEDTDGSTTVEFLKKTRKASALIAGLQPQSLGLHPAVYCFTATGTFQPTAFLASISIAQDMREKGELIKFTENRMNFEELLLKYKPLINQIVKKYGSGNRSLSALVKLYRYLFDGAVSNKPESETIPIMLEDPRLAFLKPIIDVDKGVKAEFTSERKSAVFLREALEAALRCSICGARLHPRSTNIDHIIPKSEGGRGDIDNGQLTHPYCNSAKDKLQVRQGANSEPNAG